MRGQIQGGDSILMLTATFSRIMRVSTGADVSPAPCVEQSTMVSGCDIGRGRDHDFRGRGSFGRGCESYSGRHNGFGKEP